MKTARRSILAILLLVGVQPAAGAASTTAPNPYAPWRNGPPRSSDYFPIAVWLQNPRNAERFKAAGINLYVGLWKGPTEAQLDALRKAGMPVICAQNEVGLAHRDDPIIVGWMHGDEPDNAQVVRVDPVTKRKIYGGPVPPPKVVSDYERMRAADPTRPVLLNLGQGVANDRWRGRGKGAHPSDYLTYVKGADIVSFDVYPVAGLRRRDGENYLWYVARGVDRLRKWTGGRKIVWNCIECTRIKSGRRATPDQVRAEVWMAIVHGSMGLIYFVHEWKPRFKEAALLDDPEMLAAVSAINRQIHELAPVLNSPTIQGLVSVESSNEAVPIDIMVKRRDGALYIFAVAMRNGPTRGAFEVRGFANGAEVKVLGERRTIALHNGRFEDDFRPYDVHIYKIEKSR